MSKQSKIANKAFRADGNLGSWHAGSIFTYAYLKSWTTGIWHHVIKITDLTESTLCPLWAPWPMCCQTVWCLRLYLVAALFCDKHHWSHCQSDNICLIRANTETQPGYFSTEMTNWRSFQSLIVPGSLFCSWSYKRPLTDRSSLRDFQHNHCSVAM